MELVVKCHLLAATLHYFGMQSMSDSPRTNSFDVQISQRSITERSNIFRSKMEDIIRKYVISKQFSAKVPDPTTSSTNPHLLRIQLEHSYGFVPPQHRRLPPSLTDVLSRDHASESVRKAAPDGVFNYASSVLNDGLLLLEFQDAIKEGDGVRILRCWKVFLMYFFYARHKNYQLEAFHLLAQVSAAASQRIAHQLTWSCVVNTHGGKGKNIPLDLHMEHLNRVVKDNVATLGANVAESSILQCGRSLKRLMDTCSNFDEQLKVGQPHSSHTRASTTSDEALIMKELTETARVFDYTPGRIHPSFRNIHPSIAEHIDTQKLIQWLAKKKKELHDSIIKAKVFHHNI